MRALVSLNSKLIWRAQIYWVYFFVTLLYVCCLSLLTGSFRLTMTAYILFTDPMMISALFVGVLVLMENNQNVTDSLLLLPLSEWKRFFAKFVSLFILTCLSVLVIVYTVIGPSINIVSLFLVLVVSSYFSALLTYQIVKNIVTLNGLLFWITLISLFMNFPLLALFNYLPVTLANLFPSFSIFQLIYHDLAGQTGVLWGQLSYVVMLSLALSVLGWRR